MNLRLRNMKRTCSSPPGARGVTLIELSLSLTLTGLLALSAVAVAALLRTPDLTAADASEPGAAVSRSMDWLSDLVRASRAAGYAGTPSASEGAALVLWHEDTFSNATIQQHDFVMQRYELRLVRHDPATGELVLYVPKAYSTLTRSQKDAAAMTVTEADFQSTTAVDVIAATAWMEQVRIGGNVGTVTDAEFGTSQSGARTLVTLKLWVTSPDGFVRSYMRSISLMKTSDSTTWSDYQLLRAPDPTAAS